MYGFFSDGSVSLLDKELRELAIGRMGYLAGSQFIYSQRGKALRRMGMDEARIAAIPYWAVADVWSAQERAVLAYTDAVVGDRDVCRTRCRRAQEAVVGRGHHGADVSHLRLPAARRVDQGAASRVRRRARARGRSAASSRQDLGAFASRHGVDKRS